MPPPLNGRFLALAWVVGLALALSPLLMVEIPPLADYPSHLARQFILLHFDDMPALQAGYAVDWGIKPNLAMDAVVPWLACWMPLTAAARLFLALSLAMLVGGTAALTRALHGRVGVLPMAAMLFLYNLALLLGLVNFLASAGIMLLTLALWIASAEWSPLQRGVVFAGLSVTVFFAHLFPLAVLVLAAGSFEISRWCETRRFPATALAVLAMAELPSLLLWTIKPLGPPTASFAFGDIGHRLTSLLGATIFAQSSDSVILVVAALGAIAAIRAAHGLPFVPSMRLLLLVLLIAALLIPRRMLGGDNIDLRLPVLLPFLMLAALPPGLLPTRLVRPFISIVLLSLAWRSLDVALSWREMDSDFSEFRQASRVIAPGARVLAFHEMDDGRRALLYPHITELAVLERCVFVPHMAKLRDQQPVIAATATAAIDGGTAEPVDARLFALGADQTASDALLGQRFPGWERPYYAHWPQNFDYVVHVHARQRVDNPRPDLLERMASGSFFDIYRIRERHTLPLAACGVDGL
jgi:hypothetical protein